MRTSFAAFAASALPWPTKISPFLPSKSLRSIPCLRGKPPTNTAHVQSLNALLASSVTITSCSVGKLQSFNSIATPSRPGSAGVISNSCRITFVSPPKTSPEANRPSMAYATCPAAPVTATRITFAMFTLLDPSPPRKQGSLDPSPPRKQGSLDPSPPRKQGSLDPSPPRKQGSLDPSPPRKQGSLDPSPPRKQGSLDPSPPRKQGSLDPSPPRKQGSFVIPCLRCGLPAGVFT